MIISLENCRDRQRAMYGFSEFSPSFRQRNYLLGHVIEEVGEARKYIPRKAWKTQELSFLDSQEQMEEYLSELVDIHLFLENFLVFSHLESDPDFEGFYRKSESKNSVVLYGSIIDSMNTLILICFNSLMGISNTRRIMSEFADILRYSGITVEQFFKAYKTKVNYNRKREDHAR